MRDDIERDHGVTYIGPRAFVAGFVLLCALFGGAIVVAPQVAQTLERTASGDAPPLDGAAPASPIASLSASSASPVPSVAASPASPVPSVVALPASPAASVAALPASPVPSVAALIASPVRSVSTFAARNAGTVASGFAAARAQSAATPVPQSRASSAPRRASSVLLGHSPIQSTVAPIALRAHRHVANAGQVRVTRVASAPVASRKIPANGAGSNGIGRTLARPVVANTKFGSTRPAAALALAERARHPKIVKVARKPVRASSLAAADAAPTSVRVRGGGLLVKFAPSGALTPPSAPRANTAPNATLLVKP